MRLKVYFSAIVISFVALSGGLFYTQIFKSGYYKDLSEQNRIVVIPLEAPRGKILDRNGKVIVDNRISFEVSIIYKDVRDIQKLAALISEKLNIETAQLFPKMLNAKKQPFAPTTIIEDIGRTDAIILEQYRIDYPGLIITTRPKRNYLYGNAASSITGYLGRINEEELSRLKTYGYVMTDLVGRSGLEKYYDGYLRGSRGGMQVETDALGRQKRILHIRNPEGGKPLYLTVNIDLQKYCDELMEGRRGSIICMNPQNGEIFAFVSKPNFDPSIFISPEKAEEVKEILDNVKGDYPLVNRGIQCTYPPGSIFKVVVASAALDTGKFSKDENFSCNGSFRLLNRTFRCWKPEGHGEQVIDEGLKNSCNVFFYQLGLKVGVDDISLYAKKLGFGRPTGVDLPEEVKGFVPTPQWKRQALKDGWYPGDTVNYSIGQGYLLVSPIQVISMMAAFANGGYLVTPYVVDRIDIVKVSEPRFESINLSDEAFNLVRSGLMKVVNDPRGTGMKAKLNDIVVAGKTGTAQTSEEGKTHGWFSGFAPFENSKVCVLVFDEFGGKGGFGASGIARQVLEKCRGMGLL